jgi:recombination protein RecT
MTATRQQEEGTAVARTAGEQKLAIINARLKRLEPHLAAVLPKFITPERMIRVALLAINRQPKLLSCTAESLAESMMTIATWGLEIGRTAHIVPFGDKAQAQADYKGMIELAIRCGSITSCRARVVHERDEFRVAYGLQEELIHVPTWREEAGNAVGVYAVAGLPSGEQKFDLMSAADVDRIRRRSKAKDDGPWKTDPEEMWKKTVVKRLLKMVPQNPLLSEALALDDDEREETAQVVRSAMTHRAPSGDGYDAVPRKERNILASGKQDVPREEIEPKPPINRPLPEDPYLGGEEDAEIDRRLAEQDR